MSDFTFYLENGWNHIISLEALDHLLFLIALTAIYSLPRWKQVAVLVTAFTIGHSITLAMSVYDIIRFRTEWVEFLIPLTIALTCLTNLIWQKTNRSILFQYVLALLFGLIHGMGFANTLRFMLAREQSLGMPLLGFNVGIEAAQILAVLLLLLAHHLMVRITKLKSSWWGAILSTAAGLAALYMCFLRWPL